MKRIIVSIISVSVVASFSACIPQVKPRQRPAPVLKPFEPGTDRVPANPDADPERVEPKKRDDVVDPAPPEKKIPPPPKPNNPDYGIKVADKPGYVKSPYDGEQRLIDVRGLPPGTEAECPYTRRTFLVPP